MCLVRGLVAIFDFPIYWVANHPNWLIFFRGVETTNQIIMGNYGILWDIYQYENGRLVITHQYDQYYYPMETHY